MMGVNALRTIIGDSIQMGTHVFMRKGDYHQALEDFHQLRPKDVKILGEVYSIVLRHPFERCFYSAFYSN